MKVLKVAEVLPELEKSLSKKKVQQDQIQDIKQSIDKIINLDEALTGQGGNAIKDHFTLLHIPVVLLFNQFLGEYISKLKKIKSLINKYENDNGLVSQEFIEHEIKNGLEDLKEKTSRTVELVNDHFMKVRDIVSGSTISLSSFHSDIYKALRQNEETVDDLIQLDKESKKEITDSTQALEQISSFVKKIKTWEADGPFLKQATIKEIEKYFEESKTISKLIDSALEFSIKNGDDTFLGNVADWLDKIGKLNGSVDALKGTLAAGILLSKRISFTRDGLGRFVVTAHPDWLQKNGKYGSIFAQTLYNIIKKGSSSSISMVSKYFSKFQNSPSRVLRHFAGLNPGTNFISYKKILEESFGYFKFMSDKVSQYKGFGVIDIKATAKQFTNAKLASKLLKKVPFVGIGFSVVTNLGEFTSDKNQYKTNTEKVGRATAGIGMDIGVAGLTTGGALIGTAICPGPGTLIGGAIGATVGIITSIALEDKIKDFGEKAANWTVETGKKVANSVAEVADDIGDKLSDVGGFVSGLFK